MKRLAAVLVSLLAASCGVDELTELVVVIDTDLAVPAELDGLRLAIDAPSGMRETSTTLGGADDPALPLSFSLEHGGHAWLGPVSVTAEGTLGGAPVVAQTKRTSFVRGERRLLTLFLSRTCVGVACAAEETCDRGSCVTIDVPPESLPPWQGEVPPRFDGGPPPDGPMDAGIEGGMDGSPDAGDGGPPELCGDGLVECDGDCVDTSSDLGHCGDCGVTCGSSWATPACGDGACAIECDDGFADCNADETDGCEGDLGDPATCGACDAPCAGGTSLCARVGSTATCVASCPAEAPSACGSRCVDTTTDPAHCGACDSPCNPDHASGACEGGACVLRDCDPGWGDCNGDPADGCETDLDTTSDCGACGAACVLDHAVAACDVGACAVRACDAGFADCDGDPLSGCEQPITTAAHCGGCDVACSRPNGMVSCASGSCELVGCGSGFADCDGDPANGCESDVTTATDCGGCGNACPAGEPLCAMSGGSYACSAMCKSSLTPCGSSCVDTDTSPMHCGDCAMPCIPTNATGGCTGGVCTITSCDAGYADCNGNASDGCEGRLDSLAHCGACGSVCAFPNAVASCASGSCTLVSCSVGYGDCDGMDSTGCEQQLNTLANCGSCGAACSLPNATASCATGTCTLVACNAGTGDCDGDPTDGCEDLSSDPANCGMCGNICRGRPNASGVCAGGSCDWACIPGYADCDGTPGNGCECAPPAGAVSTCSGRDCAWVCAAGFSDCDGASANGCEVSTGSNPDQCGTCGNVCPARPNSTRACLAGTCGFVCNAGFGDCNGTATDGCETSTATTVAHCGACGNACPSLPNSTPLCTAGACGFSCNPGFADCNAIASDGCEVDTRTAVGNCGACGTVCPSRPNASRTCSAGVCGYTCSSMFGDCNGLPGDGCEINTGTSLSHCGMCMNSCPTPANSVRTCGSGSCGFTCTPPYENCNGSAVDGCEVDTQASLTHCGACGTACESRPNTTTTCSSGSCSYACDGSFRDCNAMTGDGCEVNTASSLSNCGMCGVSCPPRANATIACTAGSCTFTCNSTYRDCNASATDGCEVNTASDLAHCGMCSMSCPPRANATIYCSSGTCGFTCNPGWNNCNGMASDGCETSLTSLGNCGMCGAVCDISHAGESCATGSCVMGACDAGWDDCNGSASDGCETNLLTDRFNCGTCDMRCSGGMTCVGGICV